MPVSVEQFIESLSITGLLTSHDLQALRSDVAARQPPPDAETLARELVHHGKLTKFQAGALYHGKAKGLVCGEYVLLEKIGAGGMGQVFKAQHKRMKRVVAIKLLAPHATEKEKAVKRFYQEVEVAARLNHPNIVTSYDAGESQGLHYLVMEFVEGQDLSSLLRPDKKLPLDQALDIVLQAARGLEYAHEQSIVHRDIKPSNLLVDRKGHVKILDMGLARVEQAMTGANAAAGQGLTHSGEVMGTADYMAPEQSRETRTADQRADIYSLGCTLYRLVTGRVPYDGETMIKKIVAHWDQPIPPLGTHCPEAPAALERVYARMLAKDPADRYQTMPQAIADLTACRGQTSRADHAPLVTDEPSHDPTGGSFLNSGASGLGLSKKPLLPPRMESFEPPPELLGGTNPAAVAKATWWENRQVWAWAGGAVAALAVIVALVLAFSGAEDPPPAVTPPAVVQATTIPPPSKPTTPPPTKPLPTTTNPAKPPDPATPATPSKPPDPTTVVPTPAPVTPPPIPPEGIDLLKLVDSTSAVGEATWSVEGSALVSPTGGETKTSGRLQFNYAPPAEYDLHAESVTSSRSTFMMGLIVGPSRAGFSMRGNNRTTGLGDIGGKGFLEHDNPTRVSVSFVADQPMTIVCQVRPTSVRVMLNGKLVVDWKGDPQELSTSASATGPDKTKLFLHATSGVRITRYEVLPPGASPRSKPTPLPVEVATDGPRPEKPGLRVNLLRLIDVKRDAIEGEWKFEGPVLVTPALGAGPAKLQLPYVPPPAYEWQVTAVPLQNNGDFMAGLLVGPAQVGYLLNQNARVNDGKAISGLDVLGRARHNANETTIDDITGIGAGIPFTVICRVWPRSILVTLNGRIVVDWHGDPKRLGLHSQLAIPDTTKLFVRCNGGFRIIRCEVSPLVSKVAKVPAAESVDATHVQVRELVAELPASASAPQKSARAKDVHYQAALVDDEALRYSLLTEAVKMAVAADDLSLLGFLAEDLSRCFEVDAASIVSQALHAIATRNRPANERKELVYRLLEAAEEQRQGEQYDMASVLVKTAAQAVAKTSEADLKKEAGYRELEVTEGEKLFAAVEPARKTLADEPDHAEANLTVGQYLAIARHDWTTALKHLAKGHDPLVRAAAQLDSQAGGDATRTAEVGTAWLDAAEKAAGPAKAVYLERARTFFARAGASLKGPALAKALARYKKVDTEARKLTGTAFLKRHPVRAPSFGGHWYQLIQAPLSWHQARERCQELGGDLVCLETAPEAQGVYQFAAAQFGKPDVFDFWVCATEEGHEGVFAWVNGSPFQFTDWDSNQPGGKDGQAVFARRSSAGATQFKWVDTRPNVENVFVCEWDR